ncbi:MAG: HAD family hydrolase [bacterium]|nr:HAD family hydrolase [bacterium]
MMYKNYIFDLYGTLIDIHTDEDQPFVWDKLSAFYTMQGANYNAAEIMNAYRSLVSTALASPSPYTYREVRIEYIFAKLFSIKDVHPSDELLLHVCELFRVLSTDYIKLYPGAKELLGLLRDRHTKLYLLSNAQRVFTEYEMKSLGIYEYFDGILFSSDAFCQKPEQAFYDRLFTSYQLEKSDSLMIGNDSITDIQGASIYGLDTLYLHSNQSNSLPSKFQATYIQNPIDLTKVPELLKLDKKVTRS